MEYSTAIFLPALHSRLFKAYISSTNTHQTENAIVQEVTNRGSVGRAEKFYRFLHRKITQIPTIRENCGC